MDAKPLLLLDDLSDTSAQGRRRSRLLRHLAEAFAKKIQCPVESLFVMNLSRGLLKKKDRAPILEEYQEEIKKIEKLGLFHVRAGPPIEEILEFETQQGPFEMILMGTRRQSRWREIFLGGTCEEVLRRAQAPLLVLGPRAQEEGVPWKGEPPLKVLVLTDLTSASRRAEELAISLCQRLKAHPTLFHSVGDEILHLKESFHHTQFIPYNLDEIIQSKRDRAQQGLKAKVKKWTSLGLSADSVFVIQDEFIEKSLKKEMAKSYDLIVVGTHGRTKLLNAFLGSTARSVLMQAPAPVVVVRSL